MKKLMVLTLTLALITAMAVTTANAQEIHIPDAELAQLIREALGLPDGAITVGAMRKLTALKRATDGDYWGGIVDLTGLEHAVNLERLDLQRHTVSDISPLAGLTNLVDLDLSNTDVSDISPLASLTNLTWLRLGATDVSDISALAGLTNLTRLQLGSTDVSDISPLAGLTNLVTLALNSSDVSDISALASLTNLTELYLFSTAVSDISPLASLTNLVTLQLDYTDVSDISPLVNLPNLKWLHLLDCPLSPASRTHVSALRAKGIEVKFSEEGPPPPPPPPTWVLEDSWQGPRGDQSQQVEAIAFAGNNLVFWGSGNRLYKWDFEANRAWWQIFKGRDVVDVAVPPWRNVVAYALSGNNGEESWVSLRRTTDLSWVAGRRLEGVLGLSADASGKHVAVHGIRNYAIYDILDGRGLQPVTMHNTSSVIGALAISSNLRVRLNGVRPNWLAFLSTWEDWSIKVKNSYRFKNLPDISVADNAFISGPFAVKDGWDGGLIAVASDARIYYFTNKFTNAFTTVTSIANRDGEGHTARAPITSLAVMQSGSVYATSTAHDDFVCFWDLDTGALAQKLDVGFRSAEIAFSQDNSYMAVANGSISGGDRSIKIYRWTGTHPDWLLAPAKETERSQPTALLSNYPNPFNPETWIPYQLSDPAEVTVSIYSVDGKLVRTLELGQMPAGVYSDKGRAAYWNGQNEQGEPVASGVYFYTLKAGEFSATRKMVIRK